MTQERLASVPRTILLICLAIITAGQLLRVPTSTPELTIQMLDIVVGLFILASFIALIFQKFPLYKQPFFKPYLIILSAITLSWIPEIFTSEPRQILVGILYALRFLAYASIPLVLPAVFTSRFPPVQLQKLTSFTLLVIALGGIIQYIFLPDLRFTYAFGWDEHLHRLVGTILDPGFTGLFISIALIYQLPRITSWFTNFQPWSYQVIQWLFLLICLTLTFSRASYLAFLVGIFIFSIITRAWKILITSIIILMLLITLSPKPEGEGVNLERTSTVNFRLINWQQAVHVIKTNPITGVGYNRYRYIPKPNQNQTEAMQLVSHSAAGADNSYLFILATMGTTGLALFAWAAYLITKHMPFSQAPEFYAISAALGTHAFFHNSLFYMPVMYIYFLILGIYLQDRRP